MAVVTWVRPWVLWAASVALLLALTASQSVRLADEQAAHAETKRQHAEALKEAAEKARETETALRGDIDRIQAETAKEMENAKAREDALVESVRIGNRRLSVRAVCPAGPGVGSAPSRGGGASLQRAELDPAAAERILAIGRDADRNTRERNACVEAYEAVRARLNAGAAPEQTDN